MEITMTLILHDVEGFIPLYGKQYDLLIKTELS